MILPRLQTVTGATSAKGDLGAWSAPSHECVSSQSAMPVATQTSGCGGWSSSLRTESSAALPVVEGGEQRVPGRGCDRLRRQLARQADGGAHLLDVGVAAGAE